MTINPKSSQEPQPPLNNEPTKENKKVLRETTDATNVIGKNTSGTINRLKKPLSPSDQKSFTPDVAKMVGSVKNKDDSNQVASPKKSLLQKSPRQSQLIPLTPDQKKDKTDIRHFEAIKNLLTFLKPLGYKSEGMFRLAGNKDITNILLKKLQNDPEAPITIAKLGIDEAIDALKNTIKQVHFDTSLAEQLLDIGKQDPIDLERVKTLPLTNTHKKILNAVLEYVGEIAKNSKSNNMGASNLAIILAPWFTAPPHSQDLTAAMQYIQKNEQIAKVFEAIINQNISQNNTAFTF